MTDGKIRIGTELDTSGIKADIKRLQSELNNIRKEQAKVDAQADRARAKYNDELEFDSQFPEEFSHRDEIDRRAAAELDPIIEKQTALNQKEQEYIALLEAANQKLQQQSSISNASKELDGAVKGDAFMSKISTQQQYNSLLAETQAKMASIEAHAQQIANAHGISASKLLAANPTYRKLADQLKILKNNADRFGDSADKAGRKAEKGMKRATSSTKQFGTAISSGIKKVGTMALAVFGIRSAFSAVRTAVNEYMATNEKLSGQIQSMKSLLGQVLGPAIQWIVNLLSQAVTMVNSFVYALTGINYVARANAAALNKQAQAAAAVTAQLAGFDEQNKVSDNSSGSGSGVSGLLDDTIKNLPSRVKEAMEEIKAYIKSGDWFGAGKSLGDSLMEWISSIDVTKIGRKVGEIIGKIISFALGFATGTDPTTINGAINGFVGGLLQGLTDELAKCDWEAFGKTLCEFILLGFATSDPAGALIAILLSPNSDDLAKGVSGFVGLILGALLRAIFGVFIRLYEIGKYIFDSIKQGLDENIDWSGTPEEIINGLWEGIKKAHAKANEWTYNNIYLPFINAFKKAFGIASPSKEMEEQGGYIIDGLYQGIKSKIDKVVNTCKEIWERIKGVFSPVGSWFKNTFGDAWQKVKDVFSKDGKIFDGIKEGIASTFKTIVNGLIDGINKIIRVPFNSINSMLNTIRSIKIVGLKPFESLWGYNPLSVPQIPKLALGGIVNRPGRGIPAIVGEAGAEAVLPLENNTEWMDMLAEKIGGNVTIPIYMDGKKIATYVVDVQKKKAFAMNGV